MALSQRSKGVRAEREVARLVQSWWRLLEPSCEFVRTPSSGGWSGAAVRGAFRASGDLMTTAARWPFCVEVKRRESLRLTPFLLGRASHVWPWWRQAVEQAVEQADQPMLWVRRNRGEWLVLMADSFARPRLGLRLDVGWVGGADSLHPSADCGGVLPCGLLARRLLGLPPVVFARPVAESLAGTRRTRPL